MVNFHPLLGADMKKRCLVVGAGEGYPKKLIKTEEDFLIAADGGLTYVEEQNLIPDLILGDFDSLGYDPSRQNNPAIEVRVYPVEKDDTDMGLAIQAGLDAGCEQFYLFGGQGGRIDHTLANIQSMRKLVSAGKEVFLYGEDYHMTIISNGKFVLPSAIFMQDTKCMQNVSVFALSDIASGVTIRGAKYEAKNINLTADMPLGVSNSFAGHDIEISVKQGYLLILWQGKLMSETSVG